MPSVLITGAGRGIGLELAKRYAAEGWQVHATIRDPARGDLLEALQTAVTIHQLEVTDKSSTDALSRKLHGIPLDVVIANAGVIGPRGMTIDAIDRDSWMETLAVNTIGPMATAAAFKRNLEKGKQKKLIAITSILGSIGSNTQGGFYAYRSAKAGLNAVWQSLSIDLAAANFICTVLHPGWTRTEMGGKGADIEVEESGGGLKQVIDGLTSSDNGKFFNYKGEPLPW